MLVHMGNSAVKYVVIALAALNVFTQMEGVLLDVRQGILVNCVKIVSNDTLIIIEYRV